MGVRDKGFCKTLHWVSRATRWQEFRQVSDALSPMTWPLPRPAPPGAAVLGKAAHQTGCGTGRPSLSRGLRPAKSRVWGGIAKGTSRPLPQVARKVVQSPLRQGQLKDGELHRRPIEPRRHRCICCSAYSTSETKPSSPRASLAGASLLSWAAGSIWRVPGPKKTCPPKIWQSPDGDIRKFG